MPYLGRTLRTSGGLARAADDLARDALPALDRVAAGLTYDALRPSGDRVALDPLVAAREPLARVVSSLTATEARVRALPASFVLGPVRSARSSLLGELASLRGSAAVAELGARLGPPMLGAEGPRRYFVAILTNAELRGSGGLLGAYAILEADRGRLRLRELGTNSLLRNVAVPAVDLGPEFAARYDRFAARSYWVNANMSPHFPAASAVWTALWARTHGGERLDGTIAVDPVGLAAILRVTGPARLASGEVVTADNVVDLTEREAYARYAADNRARDAYLQDVARAAYQRVVSTRASASLLSALASAAGSRHLQVASEHPDEAAALAAAPIAGVLPETDRPYVEVTTQNAAGNKLDYYLRRSVTYERVDAETSRITVRLRNDAPPGLPAYVSNRLDLPGLKAPVPGQHRVYLSVFTTTGGGLLGATLDGAALAMESETERGHPVLSAFLPVDPGRERVLVLTVRDPGRGAPLVRPAPGVAADDVTVRGFGT
ncbi:MAG TPA: DUF4012 domain-containing protein [Mycobacteriales bacterium]|nr:DUF4012 domain-containing protein [Mycobacteriales bacterium]